jgi:hypothetical protein
MSARLHVSSPKLLNRSCAGVCTKSCRAKSVEISGSHGGKYKIVCGAPPWRTTFAILVSFYCH